MAKTIGASNIMMSDNLQVKPLPYYGWIKDLCEGMRICRERGFITGAEENKNIRDVLKREGFEFGNE